MMKRFLSLLLAAMMLLAVGALAEDTVPATEVEPPVVDAPAEEPTEGTPAYLFLGDKLADFTVTLSDGTEMTLSKLLETKEMVLLNFWATWCGPCRMEFPYMQEAYTKYQDKVEVIALSVEPTDTNEVIESFKAENGLTTLPMGQDTTGLSDQFYFDGIPTSVVIDRFGVVCWQESGSITSTDKFERLFSGFLGEDYTESKVGYVIPGPKPTVPNAAEADLTAALNVEGGTLAFTNDADEYAWPFVPTEDGKATSTNAGCDETAAVLHTTVTAKAGDALSFDYTVSSEANMDYLTLAVNGALEMVFSGEDAGTYVYAFNADGEYAVTFSYKKDPAAAEGADFAAIDNVQVLTGDAATAAVATLPTYPLTLEGYAYEIVPTTGKEVTVVDKTGMYDAMIGGMPSYVIGADEATFSIRLGTDMKPEMAFVYDDCTGAYQSLTDLPTDENGFLVTLPLSSVEAGGYSSTYVYLYADYARNPEAVALIYVYANEENLNYFLYEELPAYGLPGVTWTYADGTAPTTDAVAQVPATTSTPNGMAAYTVTFVDQSGNPVENVMAQICDAETCEVIPSDANGVVAFTKAAYAYEVHVLIAPAGYTFDTAKVYVMPVDGGEVTIVGTKN